MSSISGDLWVFIETSAEGEPANVGLELLNPGRSLCDELGCQLVAVVIAANPTSAVRAAREHGADLVICIEDEAY